MVTMQIIGQKELNLKLNRIKGITKKAVKIGLLQGGNVIKNAAIENIKKNGTIKTRTMSRSLEVKPLAGELAVLIGSPIDDPPYPTYIEFGTAPHVISIKNKKVLADGKGKFFGKKVNHPGTQAKPFLRPALDENIKAIESEIAKVIRLVL